MKRIGAVKCGVVSGWEDSHRPPLKAYRSLDSLRWHLVFKGGMPPPPTSETPKGYLRLWRGTPGASPFKDGSMFTTDKEYATTFGDPKEYLIRYDDNVFKDEINMTDYQLMGGANWKGKGVYKFGDKSYIVFDKSLVTPVDEAADELLADPVYRGVWEFAAKVTDPVLEAADALLADPVVYRGVYGKDPYRPFNASNQAKVAWVKPVEIKTEP